MSKKKKTKEAAPTTDAENEISPAQPEGTTQGDADIETDQPTEELAAVQNDPTDDKPQAEDEPDTQEAETEPTPDPELSKADAALSDELKGEIERVRSEANKLEAGGGVFTARVKDMRRLCDQAEACKTTGEAHTHLAHLKAHKMA